MINLLKIVLLLSIIFLFTGCADPYYGLDTYFSGLETTAFDQLDNVYILKTTLHSEESKLQEVVVPEIYGMQKGACLFTVLDLDTLDIFTQIQTIDPTGYVSREGTYSPQADAYYYLTNGSRGLFKIDLADGEISDLIPLPIPPMGMSIECTKDGYIIVFDSVINREEGNAMLVFDTKTDTVVGDIIYYQTSHPLDRIYYDKDTNSCFCSVKNEINGVERD